MTEGRINDSYSFWLEMSLAFLLFLKTKLANMSRVTKACKLSLLNDDFSVWGSIYGQQDKDISVSWIVLIKISCSLQTMSLELMVTQFRRRPKAFDAQVRQNQNWRQNWQIPFCKIFKKYEAPQRTYSVLECLHLIGHTLGFRPQTEVNSNLFVAFYGRVPSRPPTQKGQKSYQTCPIKLNRSKKKKKEHEIHEKLIVCVVTGMVCCDFLALSFQFSNWAFETLHIVRVKFWGKVPITVISVFLGLKPPVESCWASLQTVFETLRTEAVF